MQIQEHYINDEYLDDGQNKRITVHLVVICEKRNTKKLSLLQEMGIKFYINVGTANYQGSEHEQATNKPTTKKTTPIAVLKTQNTKTQQ